MMHLYFSQLNKNKIKILNVTYQFSSLLASQRSGKVCLIPLPEGKAVDEDDAVLHQGLGSDQLVVGGIVDHINDPGLACAACIHKQKPLVTENDPLIWGD